MFKEKAEMIETKDEILRKMGVENVQKHHLNKKDWSDDVFVESYVALKKELEKSENPKLTLLKFYEDAYCETDKKEFSDYEDRFSMPLLHNFYNNYEDVRLKNLRMDNWQESKNIIAVDIRHILGGPGGSGGRGNPLKEVVYGPSRLYKLNSGRLTFIPNEFLGKNDVLGSDAFTACTAIIIKMPQGIFYAHVTTGIFGVEELLEELRKEINPDLAIHIIRPKWETETEEDKDIAHSHEKNWQNFEKKHDNLIVETYPYIASGSKRPNNINESSTLINDGKIIIIGRKRVPRREWPDHERYTGTEKDSAFFDYETYREVEL